jgi:exopolyphosphatase/guanosine-5'-triphosphate,3'-diphosphate pyrophosphatase
MKCGVVDIGSNAIRAVVYGGTLLSSPVIFHSKFKCDVKALLDKDEDNTSNQIYSIFDYFSYYFKNNDVINVRCVATEVLRKHSKALDFIKKIKNLYNLDIKILTGNEEATLSAKGLILGIQKVDGLGVDFGGGSLELIKIIDSKIKKTISIPFGTNLTKDSLSIEKVFENISENFLGENFTNLYLIGGTFRFIGRDYMHAMRYHIKVLHNIIIPITSFYQYLEIVQDIKNAKLADSQKNAISIIKSIAEITGTKSIIISSYGLKEGVRADCLLSAGEIEKNLIHERVSSITGIKYESEELQAYFDIISKLDINNVHDIKEPLYFAIMFSRFYSESGSTMGGSFIYDFITNIDIPFTEKQRIILANSLSIIFLHLMPYNIKKLAKIHLSNYENIITNIVGNFIKIASEIDGSIIAKPSFKLVQNGKFIEVETNYNLPNLIYHKIKYNLKELSFFIRKLNEASIETQL